MELELERKTAENGEAQAENALTRMLIVGSALTIAVIVAGAFLAFPADAAWQIVVGGSLASLLAILVVTITRITVLRPVDTYQTEQLANRLTSRIVQAIQATSNDDTGIVCYARWNDVPWGDLLREARRLEFVVSYMDTWIIMATEPLLQLLRRDGDILAYLPEPTEANVSRLQERFPEYSTQVITEKVRKTESKLQALLVESESERASVTVNWTSRFIMHCLMRLDDKTVVLSPFDHYRRHRIEGPAFVIDVQRYPEIGRWTTKEFEGFATDAVRSSGL